LPPFYKIGAIFVSFYFIFQYWNLVVVVDVGWRVNHVKHLISWRLTKPVSFISLWGGGRHLGPSWVRQLPNLIYEHSVKWKTQNTVDINFRHLIAVNYTWSTLQETVSFCILFCFFAHVLTLRNICNLSGLYNSTAVLLRAEYCSVYEHWGCMETAHFRPKPAFDVDGTNFRKILKKKKT
jgi:hypothetical protein